MVDGAMNGSFEAGRGWPQDRVNEFQDLLASVQPLISNFISNADCAFESESQSNGITKSLMPNPQPEELNSTLDIRFPSKGLQVDGVVDFASKILGNSLNTWSPGFISHLYSSTDAVGVVSELVLAVLNTNVHVYETSPALSIVEKNVTKALAALFGFSGPFAGGVSQQGGSAANLTAVVTARNTLFPETKTRGMTPESQRLVLFTSAGGHYSLEKAAQICGLGSAAVWSVPAHTGGRMDVEELEASISRAKREGYTPFFVNATAGTTILGEYDLLPEIAEICKRHGLWFHVDASWGGGVVFSSQLRRKMKGAELADSITFNPHKMLNVPLTCSFLLVSDWRKLWKSSTLPASYLFHNTPQEGQGGDDDVFESEPWDLADMTLQCGRRGDSLKMAFGWLYYGTSGYESRINRAFELASKLADLVADSADLVLVSARPPPCLSVCFYHAPQRRLGSKEQNSERTKAIVKRLKAVGFAIEQAVGQHGHFLRAVLNLETREPTVRHFVAEVVKIGQTVMDH